MQRGLGEAARSWGGSAAKGGSHGANSGADAGSAHRPKTTRALPWSPPLALCRGFPHSRFASRKDDSQLD
ncbi:hypothetical protein [Moorena bouillonii]|uniref:hypothetical protein n=1 Tax=Moorena bouillonii TaxID=207920 RepID=UPI00118112B9|nr:hypothetical protein [Moorena bouillonii]